MKCIFPVLFLFFLNYGFSQRKDHELISAIEVFYSRPVYQNFYPSLNKISSFDLHAAPEMFGVKLAIEVTNNKYSHGGWPAEAEFNVLITDVIQYNDSIDLDLNGHSFGLGLLGFDFFSRSKNIDLVMLGGFNSGRLRLSNIEINQRNSLLAAKLNLTFRARIKKISLSIVAEYQFDISNNEWYKLHFGRSQNLVLTPFRQHGFRFNLGIGKAKN